MWLVWNALALMVYSFLASLTYYWTGDEDRFALWAGILWPLTWGFVLCVYVPMVGARKVFLGALRVTDWWRARDAVKPELPASEVYR